MRDSILVQEDEVEGSNSVEKKTVLPLVQLASDKLLERFVPPRWKVTKLSIGPYSMNKSEFILLIKCSADDKIFSLVINELIVDNWLS